MAEPTKKPELKVNEVFEAASSLFELYKQLYMIIDELVRGNRLWAPIRKLGYIRHLIIQLREATKAARKIK